MMASAAVPISNVNYAQGPPTLHSVGGGGHQGGGQRTVHPLAITSVSTGSVQFHPGPNNNISNPVSIPQQRYQGKGLGGGNASTIVVGNHSSASPIVSTNIQKIQQPQQQQQQGGKGGMSGLSQQYINSGGGGNIVAVQATTATPQMASSGVVNVNNNAVHLAASTTSNATIAVSSAPPPASNASTAPQSNAAPVTQMDVEDDDSPLTNSELQMLSGLDSRQFGFLLLNTPDNARKKYIVQKVINHIERMLVEEQKQKEKEACPSPAFALSIVPVPAISNSGEEKIVIEPKTYCKLGHFHLLLEDYEKALSAYQKYYQLLPDEYWKDSTLLYGLGLCYFHFNAFTNATEAFQKLLYQDPSFIRYNEVHLRLGLMRKIEGNLSRALKHFNIALADQTPCTFTPNHIKFHIAHLYETVNQSKLAKENYEALLKEKDLPVNLRATAYQQLGWITHNCEELGEKSQREPVAIHSFQKALESDPRSGQSLYLLGRCYASIGKVHDAFLAYRNSVDKSEGNADTWCSIGVLYQQQNQPLDALQAYICAVQLDKFHVSAWTNLGVLYESVNQPRDALACYVNAGRGHKTKHPSLTMNPSLKQRIQFIQNGLSKAPTQTVSNKPRHLPVIEEAWNLPISAEMTARQQQQQSQRYQHKANNGSQPNSQQSEIPPKRFKMEESTQGSAAPPRPIGLTQNQLQALQTLQNHVNQGFQLNHQQQQVYNHLSHQYRLAQQHLQLQRSAAATAAAQPSSTPTNGSSNSSGNFTNSQINHSNSQNTPSGMEDVKSPKSVGAMSGSPPFSPNVTEQELAQWLGHRDIGDDLLKGSNLDFDDIDLMDEDDLVGLQSNNNNPEEKFDTRVRTISVNSDINRHSPADFEARELSIMLAAKDLQKRCRGDCKDIRKVTVCNILGEHAPPPTPPNPPTMGLTEDQLYPQTPSVFVENKKDAFSPMLQEFCLQHPIAVVRGIAAALKLDLGLFSTKTLVEAHPEHPVEIRHQNFKNYDENVDNNGRVSWDCFSRRAHSTIGWYAQYQASSFRESVKEEEDKAMGTFKDSDSDSKDSSGNKKKKPTKQLRFGTNVDLSDERKWKEQLQELQKLPAFARVVSAGNMLTHVGHVILGMNTVQLYMKVPGSRTPGHQENNNFCSININIGPGDCEWFAVPDSYWGKIYELCEKNGMHYLHGSWWPSLDDCARAKIPVYRFTQKPGDLVWVNSGCVHWVQSMGWCNNIAWNVGPLTHRQYSLAIERYEWNKLQNFKSIVPMVHLSWNLARNIHSTDPKLFEIVKSVLMRTLTHCFRLLEFVRSKGVEVRFHGRTKNDASHYCGLCELEVFNILFIKEQEKRHVVHCINCALKASPDLQGFVCLEEYMLDDLMKVYDDFLLHNLPPVPVHTTSISATILGSSSRTIPESSSSTSSVSATGL